MDTTGEEEGGTNQESSADIYTTMCKVDSWQEAAVLHRQLSLLSGDLEGWTKRVGGRLKKERIYVYLWLIRVVVQDKRTKYCKAIPTFLNEQNT